jgi:hypothetical protein
MFPFAGSGRDDLIDCIPAAFEAVHVEGGCVLALGGMTATLDEAAREIRLRRAVKTRSAFRTVSAPSTTVTPRPFDAYCSDQCETVRAPPARRQPTRE